MKIEIAQQLANVATIDLLSGYHQIFQGPPPDISSYIVKSGVADALLIPHDAKHWTKEYTRLVDSLSQEKPVIFFNRGDYPRKITLGNAYSIQNTISTTTTTKVILVPYNVLTLGLKNLKEYTQNPIISFVGFVPKLFSRRLLKSPTCTLLHPLKNSSALVRKFGLYNLEKSFSNSEIITRSHYGGSSRLIESPISFREVFINSIYNSDLVFAPRGDANGSQRFFETLSAGRIPIIPETGIKMPLDITSELTFLSCSTLSFDIRDVVMSWWSRLNNSEFKDLQLKNFQLYSDKLDYRKFITDFFGSEPQILDELARE
jgi:hypothetical protein